MAYTSKSESSDAYQQTKKQFDKNDTDWIKVFIELAPAGYDVYKGYSDWKLSQLVNPEYKGMDGLVKFISNPAEAGANVARAKKMIIDNPENSDIMSSKTIKTTEPSPVKVPDNIKNNVAPVASEDSSIPDRIKDLFPNELSAPPEKKAQPIKNVMEKISGLFKKETDPMEIIFRRNQGKDMKNAFDMSKSSKYGTWLKENRPGDYNRIATQFTDPNSIEGQVMKKYIESMNKMVPGDKMNLNTLDIVKDKGDVVKEAIKETGGKVIKETGEEVIKETGKKVGEEIGKEGVKEAGKVIGPGLDAAFATETIMNEDANIGQKLGSGVDLVGTGMLVTPAAPIAPFVKLGGKAINLVSSLFPKNQTRQIQTRNLALEADRKKKLNDLLRRNRV